MITYRKDVLIPFLLERENCYGTIYKPEIERAVTLAATSTFTDDTKSILRQKDETNLHHLTCKENEENPY